MDGTLAEYHGWSGATIIGNPIPLMVKKVRMLLAQHMTVKIFTARVSSMNPDREEAKAAIEAWCIKHIGVKLPVTAEKDYGMIELWDDRCKQIITNTGTAVYEM